ncbi:cyclin-C1-2-like isoform X1 [Senna tora]|uniref:Cyclin-C1-2-like isoform X1 n=1 Tax=Senna tora TaxID=362788 RepID=A0A834TRZ8_9FABA|nr:cyclin-C1-2-like isoform X1 [Senna tora]
MKRVIEAYTFPLLESRILYASLGSSIVGTSEEEMATNFWTSSHYNSKQLVDHEDGDMVNSLDMEMGITLEDFKLLKTHISITVLFCYVCISALFF